ncbi:hypothetical protein LINPERHAP1_LOCUS13385 [Linum perenne]
MKKPSCWKTS